MFHALLRKDFDQMVEDKKVASEESIRFLVDYFKKGRRLQNIEIIHADEVVQYLQRLYSSNEYGHYQLIVEFGKRDPLVQAQPNTIHYSAIDVYYDNAQIIAFVADHYHGREYHSYREVYENLQLPIRFIVAGGNTYQSDSQHCPIFTLQHLLMTAFDENLKEQLLSLADKSSDKYIQLPWFELSPLYNLYMQSFSGLINYVDYRKNKQTSALQDDCEELKAVNFDTRLSTHLECNGDKKIQNRGIEKLTAQFRDLVNQALNSYTDAELINIFYAGRYPLVFNMLKRALELELRSNEIYLIAEFIFSNQPFFDILQSNNMNITTLKKKTTPELFVLIFHNRTVLKLIGTKELCPYWLFQSLTISDGKKIKLNVSEIKLAYNNLGLLEERVDRSDELSQYAFSPQQLLFLKNTRSYASPVVKELYFLGHIDCDFVQSIPYNKLPDESFISKTADEWKEVLNEIVAIYSPASVAASFSPSSRKCSNFFPIIDEKEEEHFASEEDSFFGLMCLGNGKNEK